MSSNKDRASKLIANQEDTHSEGDELWLVSYSDMMTLLFGLFVMLYSIASTESGVKVDQTLQSISSESFASQTPVPTPTNNVNTIDFSGKIKALQTELQNIQQEKQELQTNNEKLDTELKEKSEAMKQLDTEKQKLIKEREITEAESEDATEDAETIKKQLEVKERKIASLQEELDKNIKDKQETDTKAQELEAKVDQLQKDMQQAKQEEIKEAFLAIVVKWQTKEHDLDLVIVDPNNKEFNFKKRKIANYPGVFELDSTTGPGIELWQSNRVFPGDYTVTVSFYNKYGNDKPATPNITIFSKKGRQDLPPTELIFGKKQKVTYGFTIDEQGEISKTWLK